MESWVTYFREPLGKKRWRADLWSAGRDIAFQCFREIFAAYGRLTSNSNMGTMVAQKRSDRTNNLYWEDHLNETRAHIVPWFKLFQRWREASPAFAKNHRQTYMHLVRWMDTRYDHGAVGDVARFLASPERNPSFASYLLDGVDDDGEQDGGAEKIASAVTGAVLKTLAQARAFSEFAANELATAGLLKGVFHLVSGADINRAKNQLARAGKLSRPNEAASNPLPIRLQRLVRSILEEGEAGWPGKVCRAKVVTPKGEQIDVYCPVLPTMFLALFHLPLRVGQMKRLDSGEGDVDRFDGKEMAWSANLGPCAGYWRDRGMRANSGYARQSEGERPITGFFVNTNKTGKPHFIPWQNEPLHLLLHNLRIWQETVDPPKGPIKPEFYVDGVEDADDGKLAEYPDIFPLFRLPIVNRNGRQGSPPTARATNEFWQQLMEELERRVLEENPDASGARIVKRQKTTGQAYGAIYKPHGMRVAGITMMLHMKVPLEIVSAVIAGHASIMMTLHYYRPDFRFIHELLEAAAQDREAIEVEACLREARGATYEEAMRATVTLNEGNIRTATAMTPVQKTFWADTSIGFCIWGGSRCRDGGPLLKKVTRPNGKDESIYGPVEGGDRNCVMCRHFVTGPAWMTPLWLYGTKLTRELTVKSGRLETILDEIVTLESGKAGTEGPERRRLTRLIDRLEVEAEGLKSEQDTIAKGIWNTHSLLEACGNILADGKSAGTELLVQPEHSFVEYVEVGEFAQSQILTAAGRIYPLLHDPGAEAARDEFITSILFHDEALRVRMAPMAPAARKVANDALGKMLFERTDAAEARGLSDGLVSLADLALESLALALPALGPPIPLVSGPTSTSPRLAH